MQPCPTSGSASWASLRPAWRLGTPVSEELRTLLPTPSGYASRSTHQPRFEIPAPAATVGAITRSTENARPGACEDTPCARPRPGRSPARPAWAGKS
uniref:Uncharacterized protein n=1 Tax=Mus musculus TaxID=10090 RepID=Q3TYM8_MOUSE|nr:unnamed protein product [Mus musculus]